ncbi:hypothetical protein LHJ74_09960 [Streptomyces sp. N2-109]|uniref:Uncharacterized protein n=1 Tax=Streptomyces gossypii TaxID=2883101 RepID=A0ABT2JQR8_9ACTN|nr:hypothetical protein [Streptomyces gossypii]MCT2590234.1 hypothetical protein [Streptomyces gossypii]
MGNIERTVAFFEIVRGKDADNARMERVPWQQSLSALAHREPRSRIYSSDSGNYLGQTVELSNRQHLLVGRITTGPLQTVDLDRLLIEEMRLEGNKGTIDTTAVCFLDFGNIIGIMQSKQGSPRASAIQNWMNACGLADEEIALWPVISDHTWEKLENASAVHSFEFTYRPNPLAPPPEEVGLSTYNKISNERYPDHKITVKLEVPKRGGLSPMAKLRGHRRMQEDIHSFMAELGYLEGPTGVERARAIVTVENSDGEYVEEPLDFIKHHVTVKTRVEVHSGDSRPSPHASIDGIMEAARLHKDSLKAAVSADD